MRVLHYNCVSGISGDMNLSALLDLGVDIKKLEAQLQKLNLSGWSISCAKAEKMGIWGTQVKVDCIGGTNSSSQEKHHHEHCEHHEHSHEGCGHHHHEHHAHCAHSHHHCHGRSFAEIEALINASMLSDFVKETSVKIFRKLAEAEAQIHNKNVADVHFHEVGAVDSIIDIVGSAICLELLNVDAISVGEIELGGGFVKCEHGSMPVPAPATALLSQGFKCSLGGVSHEATTPTGMAFLATLARTSTSLSGEVLASGIGIGQRDCLERANILQVLLLNTEASENVEKMFVVEANIDDMTSEAISALCDSLFCAGALDVWQENIVMKKSRSATKVCALVDAKFLPDVKTTFFENSTTLGVRVSEVSRISLARNVVQFASSLGDVRIKERADGSLAKAEFDDIAKIAKERSIPFLKVKEIVEAEYKNSKS